MNWATDKICWETFDVNAVNIVDNKPMLNSAILFGDPVLILELIERGADVNSRDSEGNTPLHVVHPRNWIAMGPIVRNLLRRGADPNAKNNYSETPLHCWLRSKLESEFLFEIVDQGANVNAIGRHKMTPLHYALRNENHFDYEEMVEYLLRMGAERDVNAVDAYGMTPLKVARINNASADLILMLLKKGAFVNTGMKVGKFFVDNPRGIIDKKLIKLNLVGVPTYCKNSHSYRLDLYQVSNDDKYRKELEKYKRSCVNEMSRMKKQILPNKISVWKFIIQNRLVTTGPYPRGLCRAIYTIFKSRKYFIYSDVIRTIISSCPKHFWINALVQQNVFVYNNSLKRFISNEYCLLMFSSYLSQRDLFHMAVAFEGITNQRTTFKLRTT